MDDLEFVQKCVNGDKQAWDKFVEQYSRLVYRYIHNIVGAKGHSFAQSHAQDIFQEFFCFLINDDFKKLRSFKAKNGASLASWLRQVTINFTFDYLRKLKPELSLDQETAEGVTLQDLLPSKSPSAADTLILKERVKSLDECIEKLSANEKLFLELHINRNVRLEDLKEILELSRGSVDMQKSRIFDRLRDCFKGKGFTLEI